MSSRPIVSVIIPAYNAEQFVEEAINSVLAQTYSEIEIVVVNDGSTDDTARLVTQYHGIANLKYIEQQNKGVSSARNLGIRNSVGELIAFLDHDDWWLPEKLEYQVRFILANPNIPWIHTNAQVDFKGLRKNIYSHEGVQGDSFKELFARNRIVLSTVLVRRDCLDQVGLFNESFSGSSDYDLWLRIASRFPLGYIEKVLALYRIHESNMSADSFNMTNEDLMVIRSIVRDVPNIYRVLGRRAVKERVGSLAYELGGWYMWKAHDDHLAKKYFWQSIKERPSHFASYRRFIWCSLPLHQRKTLVWSWHKVRKRMNLCDN